MSLLEEKKSGQKIHGRDISISTFECHGGGVMVEGRLTDRRLIEISLITGHDAPPGVVHDMIIRIKLEDPKMTIADIEVELPHVPHDECVETQKSLDWLKGQTIAKGFSARVNEKTGGAKGCRHLSALLLAMAPAALQGFFTSRSKEALPKKTLSYLMTHFFTDTCHFWRKDGAPIKDIMKRLE